MERTLTMPKYSGTRLPTAWASHARTGHLWPGDAWQAPKSTILKGIKYPLISTCLTARSAKTWCHLHSWQDYQHPRFNYGFPANLSMIHYLPKNGLGIPLIHITQPLKHVLACLCHTWYLQALHISNILNAYGTSLCSPSWDCNLWKYWES